MSADKVRVYFTVDTETSIGGAWDNAGPPLPLTRTVFGENGSGAFGVPLIMNILEEYRFRATFFIEVFCSYYLGLEQVATVFDCIQKRGHDAQLHLHPVHRFYWEYTQGNPRREKDLLFQFQAEEQRHLIQDGVSLFRRLSGKSPRAFRAGCYGASEVTLGALREAGVLIDSSYNLSFLDTTCGFRSRSLNAPQILEGIHEFPVTNFSSGRPGSYKPLEISAVSATEILTTIRSLQKTDCRDVVLVFHSFSFLKRRGVRFEKARPDRIVIGRFRKLCQELWKMRDEVDVAVLGNVNLSNPLPRQPHTIPSLGWFHPAVRKTVQGIDHIPWV
jgi:peptidoglycan/xylan/chitin deacetylase (PgdA/CDA1 family)